MASVADLYPIADVSPVWSCITVERGAREALNPGWVWVWRFVA